MNVMMSLQPVLATTMEPRLFDLDLQLIHDAILTIIAVFALVIGMSYLLFNPVRDYMSKRRDRIAGEIADATQARATAMELKREYEDKLANINKEAEDVMAKARQRGLANEARIIAEAKDEAVSIIVNAKREAQLEKIRVKDEVKREIIAISAVMAAKVVSTNMKMEVQETLLNKTLEEMGDSTWLS